MIRVELVHRPGDLSESKLREKIPPLFPVTLYPFSSYTPPPPPLSPPSPSSVGLHEEGL